MHRKPVIGISADSAVNSKRYSYSKFPWYALGKRICDAVTIAGGIPIMFPYAADSIDDLLNIVDGLLIAGGVEDINPKFYGQEFKTDKIATNDPRASFEIELVRKALARNMPFLGICNGMQILNVVCGGDLIQHIPDTHRSDINHEQPEPKEVASHHIDIKHGSLLARIAGNDGVRHMVNSTHHQAVDKVGRGLIVSATAPDGIIEAIESADKKFVLGVEWHPEHLEQNELNLRIFKGFVGACR